MRIPKHWLQRTEKEKAEAQANRAKPHYHHYEVIETSHFEAGARIRLALGVPEGDLQLLPGERWLGNFDTRNDAERFIAEQGGASC